MSITTTQLICNNLFIENDMINKCTGPITVSSITFPTPTITTEHYIFTLEDNILLNTTTKDIINTKASNMFKTNNMIYFITDSTNKYKTISNAYGIAYKFKDIIAVLPIDNLLIAFDENFLAYIIYSNAEHFSIQTKQFNITALTYPIKAYYSKTENDNIILYICYLNNGEIINKYTFDKTKIFVNGINNDSIDNIQIQNISNNDIILDNALIEDDYKYKQLIKVNDDEYFGKINMSSTFDDLMTNCIINENGIEYDNCYFVKFHIINGVKGNHSFVCTKSNHYCDCGYNGNHKWMNGKCLICNYSCIHNYSYTSTTHTCSACNYKCTHSNGNITSTTHNCTTCGISGSHEWDNGICSVCNYYCDHSYTITTSAYHECSICHIQNEHEYVNNVCTVCNHITCDHTKFEYEDLTNHRCTACGLLVSHEWDTNMYCEICETDYNCIIGGGGSSNEPCPWCGGYHEDGACPNEGGGGYDGGGGYEGGEEYPIV